MATKMDGFGIAALGAGALFLYGGIKGQSILKAFQNVVTGKNPTTGQNESNTLIDPNANAASATVTSGGINVTPPTSNSAAANQALAKQLAIQLGHADWTTGQNWADWVALWNQESSWSITAANPSSDARGIAQNINGYNNTDYKAGDAVSQITWGINYIAGRYGNPSAAEAHERANNWY